MKLTRSTGRLVILLLIQIYIISKCALHQTIDNMCSKISLLSMCCKVLDLDPFTEVREFNIVVIHKAFTQTTKVCPGLSAQVGVRDKFSRSMHVLISFILFCDFLKKYLLKIISENTIGKGFLRAFHPCIPRH